MFNHILHKSKKWLPKNEFAHGVSVLVSGTAGSQLIMLLLTPVLTRIYSPEDFGLLAVYVGLLAVFVVIASLRYELAIPLPESDQAAANIVLLSLLALFGMVCILGLTVFLASDAIVGFLGIPELANYLWLLPIGALLMGVYQVFSYWAIRTKQFAAIAQTRISQMLAMTAVQLVGYKLGGISLLIGQTAGQGVGSTRLARSALMRAEFNQCGWRGVLQVAKKYRRFPLFSTWSSLCNAAGQQLLPLMFAAMFNVGAAGMYALAQRVLMMPMAVIGSAVGNVFFSNAAKAYQEARLGPLVVRVYKSLSQIVMPVTLLLIILAPDLFALVFGEKWRQAGDFARWMAPWLYMVFVTSPFSTVFSIMGKQHYDLFFQVSLLLLRLIAIAIGAWRGDLLVAVMLFSGVSTLSWVGFLLWINIKTGNRLHMILLPMLNSFVYAVGCMLPLILARVSDTDGMVLWIAVATSMLLLGAYYLSLARKLYIK